MDETSLYTFLAFAITTVILILSYRQVAKKSKPTDSDERNERERAAPQLDRQAGAGAIPRNRAAANRNARARMRVAQAQRQNQHSDSEEDPSQEDIVLPDGKVGKKKLAKLQAKADKRVQRENDEREREEKKEREKLKSEQRQQREKEEEEEEAKKEEEERLRKEEEDRKDQDEYEKMKREFAVESEGFDESLQGDNEKDLLNEFIKYIKASKIVVLDELAAKFQLKTQMVINRVNDLIKEGSLTGVIDDRGKFIYISEEELENVAKFIRQRGRVSITDIVEASNSLINIASEVTVDS